MLGVEKFHPKREDILQKGFANRLHLPRSRPREHQLRRTPIRATNDAGTLNSQRLSLSKKTSMGAERSRPRSIAKTLGNQHRCICPCPYGAIRSVVSWVGVFIHMRSATCRIDDGQVLTIPRSHASTCSVEADPEFPKRRCDVHQVIVEIYPTQD